MSDHSNELPQRDLGQTGLRISCIGLGTVKIGRNQGVKYPSSFNLPGDREVRSLLQKAWSLGINLIDTAPAYGSSEERIGALLGDRKNWVICSKVGEEFVDSRSSFDFSANHTRLSVERSLRRLKTDFLDIVLVHSDGGDLDIIDRTDCLSALERLKEKGLIRAVGMSTKTVEGGVRAIELTDTVMVTYNPLAQDDAAVIEKADSLDKGVLIKKGLVSGHLDTLGESGRDPVETSLEFILAKHGVSSVIIGTIDSDHLTHNVEAAVRATAGS